MEQIPLLKLLLETGIFSSIPQCTEILAEENVSDHHVLDQDNKTVTSGSLAE
jgi:hypothetical protein